MHEIEIIYAMGMQPSSYMIKWFLLLNTSTQLVQIITIDQSLQPSLGIQVYRSKWDL